MFLFLFCAVELEFKFRSFKRFTELKTSFDVILMKCRLEIISESRDLIRISLLIIDANQNGLPQTADLYLNGGYL